MAGQMLQHLSSCTPTAMPTAARSPVPPHPRLERAWCADGAGPQVVPGCSEWTLSWSCHYRQIVKRMDVFLNPSGKNMASHRYIFSHEFRNSEGRLHVVYRHGKGRYVDAMFREPLEAVLVLQAEKIIPDEPDHPWFAAQWSGLSGTAWCTTVHEDTRDWTWAQVFLGSSFVSCFLAP